MRPDVVVDIGNTRVKWGWGPPGEPLQLASLPPDDPAAWDAQLARLPAPAGRRTWAMAGVHPDRLTRLKAWVEARGDAVRVITHADVPLRIDVDEPDRVGIDRLLAALAARRRAVPWPAVIIGVGTAVTVDLVDGSGVFRGGVIFPGPRLMADALHAGTARLPLVEADSIPGTEAPGRNTADAIRAGIRAAVVGAAYLLVDLYAAAAPAPWVFVTGGAAGGLGRLDFGEGVQGTRAVPGLVLEGVRLAAEALP
jgi:type III pantothenate kinase